MAAKTEEQTKMDKITTELAEYFCDELFDILPRLKTWDSLDFDSITLSYR